MGDAAGYAAILSLRLTLFSLLCVTVALGEGAKTLGEDFAGNELQDAVLKTLVQLERYIAIAETSGSAFPSALEARLAAASSRVAAIGTSRGAIGTRDLTSDKPTSQMADPLTCGLRLIYPPEGFAFHLPYRDELNIEYAVSETAAQPGGWVALYMHVGHRGEGTVQSVLVHNSSAQHEILLPNSKPFLMHAARTSVLASVSFLTSRGFYGAAADSATAHCRPHGHHFFRTLVHKVQILVPLDGTVHDTTSKIHTHVQAWYTTDFLDRGGVITIRQTRLSTPGRPIWATRCCSWCGSRAVRDGRT